MVESPRGRGSGYFSFLGSLRGEAPHKLQVGGEGEALPPPTRRRRRRGSRAPWGRWLGITIQKVKFPAPQRPLRGEALINFRWVRLGGEGEALPPQRAEGAGRGPEHPGGGGWGSKFKKVKFPGPKRPLRARHPERRARKVQKVKCPAPKRPLWARHQEHRLENPFKIGSRKLKMEKWVFMKKWNLYWKKTFKSIFFMKT